MEEATSDHGPVEGEVVSPPPPQGVTANWIARLARSEVGTPLLPAEFVAGQGPSVRLVDVRDPQDFIGPLGYIPGSDWIPAERLDSLPGRLGKESPLVIVSNTAERASEAARVLEGQGMRYVAALGGGVVQWLSLGFSTIRDPKILDRCDILRSINLPDFRIKKGRGLTIEQVEQHLGDPLTVRWIKLAALVLHAQLSCIDGRDDRGVVGSPGGDAGRFLLALAAVETVLERRLEPDVIKALFARRVDAFGGFYMHTDHIAMASALESMQDDPRLEGPVSDYCDNPTAWRQFLRRPPLVLRDAVLEHLCNPSAIGCGHIRLMYQHGDDYRIRPGLVLDYLKAFFHARWEGAFRAEYEALHGLHDERAVLNTRVAGELKPFTLVPLIAPSSFDCQMFVYHSQVSEYVLGLLVDFLLLQTDLIPEFAKDLRPALLAETRSLDEIQTRHSLHHLAKGLPIYDVSFENGGHFRIESAGFVE